MKVVKVISSVILVNCLFITAAVADTWTVTAFDSSGKNIQKTWVWSNEARVAKGQIDFTASVNGSDVGNVNMLTDGNSLTAKIVTTPGGRANNNACVFSGQLSGNTASGTYLCPGINQALPWTATITK